MNAPLLSRTEAEDIVQALRGGLVPRRGLHHLATGMDALLGAIEQELEFVATGKGTAKWIRGEYGSGKTFATRLLCARARARGFATSEVQISINDTPLHHLETVYRRLIERLETAADGAGAFQGIVDAWLYQVGDEVQRIQGFSEDDPRLADATEKRLEDKLAELARQNQTFPAVLRAYHRAMFDGDFATAQGLIAWLSGQPHVSAKITAKANIRGALDGQAALTFLSGLLCLLRQTDRPGLVVVLDEVETIQRMNAQTRDKALNALRQLMDQLAHEQLQGLYLVVTGNRDFFEGHKGLKSLTPLYQRVSVSYGDDPRFDNLRATQVRLSPFDAARLLEVGRRVRDLYPATQPERVAAKVSDVFLQGLVEKVTAGFGGKVTVAPRVFLRELVDVIDRVEQHEAYDPSEHYKLTLNGETLTPEEVSAKEGRPSAGPADSDEDDAESSRGRARRLDG
ncbi:MAG TPA: BREX system ATP-binding protein BrxD [Polyangiaceae bacterium]|nr:BREX system ATP-binding protein BrxD [Polyangiaceae bacterium]